MNINSNLITLLKNATKLDVVPDEYDGNANKYIKFTYEDERPVFWGDDSVIADTAYLQIQLITPKSYNYLNMKQVIRDSLESNDYIVTSIQSFLSDDIQGTEKTRKTVFTVTKTELR